MWSQMGKPTKDCFQSKHFQGLKHIIIVHMLPLSFDHRTALANSTGNIAHLIVKEIKVSNMFKDTQIY